MAQATTDKDAPGAALGVKLTQGTSLPPGKALTVPTEVEEDGGMSPPQGKAPAVPTEVEGDGENLPRGKAPSVPAKVDRDERAKYNGTPAWWVGRCTWLSRPYPLWQAPQALCRVVGPRHPPSLR